MLGKLHIIWFFNGFFNKFLKFATVESYFVPDHRFSSPCCPAIPMPEYEHPCSATLNSFISLLSFMSLTLVQNYL